MIKSVVCSTSVNLRMSMINLLAVNGFFLHLITLNITQVLLVRILKKMEFPNAFDVTLYIVELQG